MKDRQLTENELKTTSTHVLKGTASNNPSRELTQKLIASEERFQSVVETATDAIILWDERGNILSWNKGAKTMFGYVHEEIVGRPLTLIIPARYHEAHCYGMELVGSAGGGRGIVKTLELYGLKKNGKEFPIEMVPSKSMLREVTFYCGIIRDNSERKQAELALVERNSLLAFEAEVGQVLNRHQTLSVHLQGCAEAFIRHLDGAWAGFWTKNS
jgi:PAS domain S-box-containing protein